MGSSFFLCALFPVTTLFQRLGTNTLFFFLNIMYHILETVMEGTFYVQDTEEGQGRRETEGGPREKQRERDKE